MTVSMALWKEECKGHAVVYAVIKYLPNCNHLIAALEIIVTNTVVNWGQVHRIPNVLYFATKISPLVAKVRFSSFLYFRALKRQTHQPQTQSKQRNQYKCS